MFEPPGVEELDVAECAAALVDVVVEQRRAGARRLAYAAHWADLHPGFVGHGSIRGNRFSGSPEDVEAPGRRRNRSADGTGTGIQLGADGTPMVSEFCGVHLGVLLETTTTAAEGLLRDALELRHRLPRLWAAVLTGQVEDWQARQVAKATRMLTADQAGWVDSECIDALVGLPFGRAMSVVEGKVIAADPDGHEARRVAEAKKRYVALGRRPNPAGLQSLVAQTTVGDVARLDAMIEHLAVRLGRSGDTDAHQVRRAKALALLADPAQACVFLANQHPAEPAESAEPAELAEPPEKQGGPSAVELAVAFGRVLAAGGSKMLDRLRARTVLYVHLSEDALAPAAGPGVGAQVARVEGLGPVGLEQLKDWLGTRVKGLLDADTVVVKPVIDPAAATAVDSYQARGDLAEAVRLLCPFEIFPWGTLESRPLDRDHTEPYVDPDEGGPPDQTRIGNLGPLGRTHHRAKTLGGFSCYQPLPGLFLWRIPSGYWYRVDHTGTHPLGRETPEILRQRRLGASLDRAGVTPGMARIDEAPSCSRVTPSRVETYLGERVDFALAT